MKPRDNDKTTLFAEAKQPGILDEALYPVYVHILLVDDDWTNILCLLNILKSQHASVNEKIKTIYRGKGGEIPYLCQGIKVYVASNGVHALKILEDMKKAPQYIITDLEMPELSGDDFLVAFKNSKRDHFPLEYWMTSYADEDRLKEAIGKIDDAGIKNFRFIKRTDIKREVAALAEIYLDKDSVNKKTKK